MDEKVRKKRSKFDRSKDIMDMGVMGVYDEKDLGHGVQMEPNREKKKKHKYRKNKCETDKVFNLNAVIEENCTGIAVKGQTCSNEGNVTFMRSREDENNKIKRKKRKKERDNNEIMNSIIAGDKEMQFLDDKQERKTKKRKKCDDSISGAEEVAATKSSNKSKGTEDNKFKSNEGGSSLDQVEMGDANGHSVVTDNDDQGKKMKKKKLRNKSKRTKDNEFPSNGGNPSQVENNEDDPHLVNMTMGDANEQAIATEVDGQRKKRKKKRKKRNKEDKRVTFSDQVEIFNDGLIRGIRFTPEEDEKIKEAVFGYIESHGLGDQGLDMVLHCGSHREIRHCWREIALALPQRPYLSIYNRAHVLFERDNSHKWTPEEYEFIRKFVENHGHKWQMLASAMGKHRFHVKDAWRRIKLRNTKKGRMAQEEYQTLFDLVNTDLRLRALEDHRKLKHGMLRDNICWEAIGEKLATRTSQFCCMKWYDQLTSPMVVEGEWTDTDDYRLLKALYTLDACSMEEVDWDNLVEHRSGEVCRKRWYQMVRHLREHGSKSFADQVEILSKRYCPELLEAREAFDNKPVVS